MFKQTVTSTAMTSQDANYYFEQRIFGDAFQGYDLSFLATLRALLVRRIPEDGQLILSFTQSRYSASDLQRGYDLGDIGYYSDPNRIFVHNFINQDASNNDAWMNEVEKSFERRFEGWHRLEKVTAFFRKVFNVICFINPELKSVVIFADNMNIRTMHYLQCGIPAFFPWYFQSGVSDLEMELLNSLREKTPDKYLDCIARIASGFDFKTERVRHLLRDFETSYERGRLEELNRQMDSIRRNLRNLEEQIASYLQQMRDTETNMLGLEMKIAQGTGDSEIMEYFLANKHLSLQRVNGSTMDFVAFAPLEFFDEDLAKRVIDNNHSFFYDFQRESGVYTHDNIKMLMTEIFLTRRLKVNFCAAYRFKIEGGVSACSGFSYGSELNKYTPNTHVDGFGCLGTNIGIVNEMLKNHDYIGAIEQCIASCKNLNLGDSTVMREFSRRFFEKSNFSGNMRCVVLPDGTVVTPKEAIQWLVNEKQSNEQQNAETAEEVNNG